jgi:hypothetical protein
VKRHEKMFSDIPKQSDDSYISHNVVPYSALHPPHIAPPHHPPLPPRKASVADFCSNIFEDLLTVASSLIFLLKKNTVSLCIFSYIYIPLAAKVREVSQNIEKSPQKTDTGRQT